MADPKNVLAWIEWSLDNYASFGFGLWALEDKTGKFLGDCGITYQDVEGRRELEIGYHIIEDERGKGYATEAARACLDYGFARTAAPLICSIVDPRNAASSTVASRIHASRREFLRRDEPMKLFYTMRREWAQMSASRGRA
jgi:RimJ/RimL family protein N-acetyltransferase